ncbi:MAG: hypothetical protein NTV52_02605 [Acidobacteria bacterium]|nr:hypothetical protein [Acidobacteriota bacterium]
MQSSIGQRALLARGEGHGGIVVASQQTYPVGEEIRRLLRLMQRLSGERMRGRIEFLSAWG